MGTQDKLAIAVKRNIPILLIGETGTGKTTMIRELAHKAQKDLIRFSITGETTVDDFVGKYELRGQETVWQDGVLLQAVRGGKWLVVDELNSALPEVLFALHSLLDDDKFVTLVQKDGEVVKAHPEFRLFATMNPSDEGNYSGTKDLNQAFMSRFGIVEYVDYLKPEQERQLLIDRYKISEEQAREMVAVAGTLRHKHGNRELNYVCSTRDLLAWADLVKQGMDIGDAFRLAVANKSGAERKTVAKTAEETSGQLRNTIQELLDYAQVRHEQELRDKVEELSRLLKDKQRIEDEIYDRIQEELATEWAEIRTGREELQAELKKLTALKRKEYERGRHSVLTTLQDLVSVKE